MSSSGAQTFAFYRDVAKTGRVWTIRDSQSQTPLVDLARDGVKVGVNWSGPRARGWDLAPSMVRGWIEWFIEHPGASIEEAHGQPLRTGGDR